MMLELLVVKNFIDPESYSSVSSCGEKLGMKKIGIILIAFLLIPISAVAAMQCEEGQDYSTIAQRGLTATQDNITVVEFFSPGCPACDFIEPQISEFEQSVADSPDVTFSRIPVVFSPPWEYYAKAYYLAKSRGIEKEVTPALFKAIHKDNENIASVDAMVTFFQPFGVSEEDVRSAFSRSPTMDAQLKGDKLAFAAYGFRGVPTIVINDQFKTDLTQAKSGDNMVSIINCLVEKVREERASSS